MAQLRLSSDPTPRIPPPLLTHVQHSSFLLVVEKAKYARGKTRMLKSAVWHCNGGKCWGYGSHPISLVTPRDFLSIHLPVSFHTQKMISPMKGIASISAVCSASAKGGPNMLTYPVFPHTGRYPDLTYWLETMLCYRLGCSQAMPFQRNNKSKED